MAEDTGAGGQEVAKAFLTLTTDMGPLLSTMASLPSTLANPTDAGRHDRRQLLR
jgi:hypothetical protein